MVRALRQQGAPARSAQRAPFPWPSDSDAAACQRDPGGLERRSGQGGLLRRVQGRRSDRRHPAALPVLRKLSGLSGGRTRAVLGGCGVGRAIHRGGRPRPPASDRRAALPGVATSGRVEAAPPGQDAAELLPRPHPNRAPAASADGLRAPATRPDICFFARRRHFPSSGMEASFHTKLRRLLALLEGFSSPREFQDHVERGGASPELLRPTEP